MAATKTRRVMAIAAHPDDIEFYMAGTLLLLGERGFELHYMTVSSGNCGSMVTKPAQTRKVRAKESRDACKILGATHHPGIADDLEIIYSLPLLRQLASVMRKVQPEILLTHSPEDYMEDHMETCRLAVTAAFSKGMPNFKVTPSRKPYSGDITIYHAMPHGLKDGLRRQVIPDFYVNTTSVHTRKREALAAHRSQKEWLDATQGMGSYLKVMDDLSLRVGTMSGQFRYAEAWRRHLHLGFSSEEIDPLRELLGELCS